jgi:hypothetical protein
MRTIAVQVDSKAIATSEALRNNEVAAATQLRDEVAWNHSDAIGHTRRRNGDTGRDSFDVALNRRRCAIRQAIVDVFVVV